MSRKEIDAEHLGKSSQRRVRLSGDGVGGIGHEGVDEGPKDVDEVDGEEDDLSASFGVVGEEGVVETVVLKVLVSSSGNGHDLVKPGSKLSSVESFHVGGEVVVDIGDEDLVRGVGSGGGGEGTSDEGGRSRDDRVELGVNKLDDLRERETTTRISALIPERVQSF